MPTISGPSPKQPDPHQLPAPKGLPTQESYTLPEHAHISHKPDTSHIDRIEKAAKPESTIRKILHTFHHGLNAQLAADLAVIGTKEAFDLAVAISDKKIQHAPSAITLLLPLAIASGLEKNGMEPKLTPRVAKAVEELMDHLRSSQQSPLDLGKHLRKLKE